MPDAESLTEPLRREIRECMDVFITDARELADKYGGEGFSRQKPEVAAMLAAAMSQQFAAFVMNDAIQKVGDGLTNDFKPR